MGHLLCPGRRCRIERGANAQPAAVPDHPPLPGVRLPRPGCTPADVGAVAIIGALLVQGVQMVLVLLAAPLLTGLVRKVKARLQRRRGASIFQPYRDLRRLIGKEVVLAENASWLFRTAPYLIFSLTWVAASLVPTFATGLMFSWTGDLIAII